MKRIEILFFRTLLPSSLFRFHTFISKHDHHRIENNGEEIEWKETGKQNNRLGLNCCIEIFSLSSKKKTMENKIKK